MLPKAAHFCTGAVKNRISYTNLADNVLRSNVHNWMDIGSELFSLPHSLGFRSYLCEELIGYFIKTFCGVWMDLDGHNWARLPRLPSRGADEVFRWRKNLLLARCIPTHHIPKKPDFIGLFEVNTMQDP